MGLYRRNLNAKQRRGRKQKEARMRRAAFQRTLGRAFADMMPAPIADAAQGS